MESFRYTHNTKVPFDHLYGDLLLCEYMSHLGGLLKQLISFLPIYMNPFPDIVKVCQSKERRHVILRSGLHDPVNCLLVIPPVQVESSKIKLAFRKTSIRGVFVPSAGLFEVLLDPPSYLIHPPNKHLRRCGTTFSEQARFLKGLCILPLFEVFSNCGVHVSWCRRGDHFCYLSYLCSTNGHNLR